MANPGCAAEIDSDMSCFLQLTFDDLADELADLDDCARRPDRTISRFICGASLSPIFRQAQGEIMRLIGLTSTLVLIGALPVLADELPSRKAGLWQLEMNIGGRIAQTMQQCIDAATDQMMQAGAGPVPRADCSKRDVQKSGNTITIDTACTVNGKPSTTHSVITGSFDSAYTMTSTSQSDTAPGGKMTITIAAKWLSACAADQKPGDMIMSNGMKTNILNMQKGAVPPVAPVRPPPR
jgi:hypothetical protein